MTLTIEEARILNEIIVEELVEFGLLKATKEKARAVKELTPRVARRFDEVGSKEGKIFLYPLPSLERVVLRKIDELEAQCV